MSREHGEQLAIFGQTTALWKAESLHEEWITAARIHFLEELASGPKTIDEVLNMARPEGMHPNAIGAMVGALSRAKRIVCVGVKTSRNTARHAGLNRIWALP